MQAGEVAAGLVEQRGVGCEDERDEPPLAGGERDLRAFGEGVWCESDLRGEVEGVELCVGFVEGGGVVGEGADLRRGVSWRGSGEGGGVRR